MGANTARVARAVEQAWLARARTGPNMALDNYSVAWQRLPTHGGAIPANGGDVRHWPEGGVGPNTARVATAVDQAFLARVQNCVNMVLDNHRIA